MMYKIKDNYGYCVTVGNADHWVRTDDSVYVVGTNDLEHCTYWTFDKTEQNGVYLITLAQNKDDYTDQYEGWGLAIHNELDFDT